MQTIPGSHETSSTSRLDRLKGLMAPGLRAIEEAMVDSWALSVSDLDSSAYLPGALTEHGYWRQDLVLAKLRHEQPLAHQIWLTTYRDAIQSPAQAAAFTEAFAQTMDRLGIEFEP